MKVICRTMSLLVLCSGAALAQKSQPIEIGFDASLVSMTADYHLANPGGSQVRAHFRSTILQFPVQSVRVGFPLNDRVSIEPSLGLLHVSSDGNSGTQYDANVALLVALTENRKEAQWFARPFVGVAHNTQFLSDTHAALGVGAGVRIPMTDRIASRIEGRYTYFTKHDDVGGHELGLYFGLSFFTH